MKKTRLCILCGERPATVPDRDRPGRPIKRVCTECHGERLRGDLAGIVHRDIKPSNVPPQWRAAPGGGVASPPGTPFWPAAPAVSEPERLWPGVPTAGESPARKSDDD